LYRDISIGNFAAAKSQEFVVIRGGNSIELLRPDDTGKLQSIAQTPLFCIVRNIFPFRLAGKRRNFGPLHIIVLENEFLLQERIAII
jgi:hypothetical protein